MIDSVVLPLHASTTSSEPPIEINTEISFPTADAYFDRMGPNPGELALGPVAATNMGFSLPLVL